MSGLFDLTTAIKTTRKAFDQLGLTFPAQVDADLAATHLTHPELLRLDAEALATAIIDAVAAGKDPATDKTILAHLARREMGDVMPHIDAILARRRHLALVAGAPAIIEATAPVVEAANAAVVAAHATVSDFDVFGRAPANPSHVLPWALACDEATKLDVVMTTWAGLNNVLNLVAAGGPMQILILADLTVTQLYDLDPRGGARALIQAGHTLSLASPAEFIRRRDNITRQQADAAAERNRQHVATFGRGGISMVL